MPELTGVAAGLGLVNLGVVLKELVELGRIVRDTCDIAGTQLGMRLLGLDGPAKPERQAQAA